MVTLVEPTNVHKIEFNATTTAGPSRVTSVTGTMPISLAALVQAKNPQCLVEMPLPLVAEAACDRFAGASCLALHERRSKGCSSFGEPKYRGNFGTRCLSQ